jgi:hypothetical protein
VSRLLGQQALASRRFLDGLHQLIQVVVTYLGSRVVFRTKPNTDMLQDTDMLQAGTTAERSSEHYFRIDRHPGRRLVLKERALKNSAVNESDMISFVS